MRVEVVAPAARGRGVGEAAIGAVLARQAREHPAADVLLSVRTANAPAVALYRRCGFVDAGPSPDDAGERRMRRASEPLGPLP